MLGRYCLSLPFAEHGYPFDLPMSRKVFDIKVNERPFEASYAGGVRRGFLAFLTSRTILAAAIRLTRHTAMAGQRGSS